MSDIFEAKELLEAATPENPVRMRIKDGAGQHVDILVSDATVKVGYSLMKGRYSLME